MQKRLVMLKSDVSGEDGAYIFGALMIPVDKDLKEFDDEATAVVDKIRDENPEWELSDLIKAIAALDPAYEIMEAPAEVTVLC